ncbi:peptide deformylase [Paracoccus sp. (in: a-proteobacteria)]|uniref:peptide deformylase n=1 Tax=Paracoccus sp. TaxID=267 RepID=UPI003A8A17CA
MADTGTQPPLLPGNLAAPGGGQVRAILIHPDPVLRGISQPAGYLNGTELACLAADLLATMYDAGGRGLAAPQIGILRRIFVMDAGWKEGAARPLVMLDPEILWTSDRHETGQEMCLSIPGQPVGVMRPVSAEIGWYDLSGTYHCADFTGIAARIALHEADHLDGRLIVDFL